MWIMFTAWLLWISPGTKGDLRLDYKTVRENLPGMLGSVTYETIWISAAGMRIDFGTTSSKIIRKDNLQAFELDHDLKEYCPISLSQGSQDTSMVFQRCQPFVQYWNEMSCQVYEYEQKEGELPYHIRLWFSDLAEFPMQDYLTAFLDLDQAVSVFPEGPPTGFPVRVTLDVVLEGRTRQALDLALQAVTEMHMPSDCLKIPADYRRIDCDAAE